VDLKTKLQNDMKDAMRASQSAKVSTLRMAIAEIKKREIDKRTPLEEAEITKLIQTLIKQRHDSIEAFTKGNRPDLAEKEKEEITFLEGYLPQQLSAGELEALVKSAIEESGAKGPNEIGKVMKVALAKTAGRADGKAVNELVKKLLSA
jgi:uncharacterized protein YqeY